MEVSHSRSYHIFARWAAFSYRYAAWVILIALFVAALSVLYTSRNLGIHTDTTDMLSEDLPFRVNHERYKAAFPQYKDTILLALNAPTPEQAHAAAKRLTADLQADSGHIQDAYYFSGDAFLERNGLLYKDISELERITDRLAAAQPLVARIADDPTLHTFTSVLTEAINELRTGRKLELESVLNGMRTTLDAQLAGKPQALSWQVLFSDEVQQTTYQELVMVQPKLDYTELFAAEQPIAAIRATAHDLELGGDSVEQLRITGNVALSYDELNSAMRGALDAGLLAVIMVAVVLFVALRSAGAVLIVLLSLMLGLALTAAFATVAVGHLNLISIAFAVLYIGLGVDYAIHFLLRYQEIKKSNQSITDALYAASGDVGHALTVCAITTAIGFYAFMPTTYRGVAELGLISGTGMLISLIVTLTIVPALQRYLPIRPEKTFISVRFLSRSLRLPPLPHKLIYIATAFALLVSVIVLPQIRFDYNLLNLNDPDAESVQTFQELLAEAEDSPWHIILLAEDQRVMKDIVQRLTYLPEVDKVVTIFDLVPTKQEDKLMLINEMALTLGPIAFPASIERDGQSLLQQREMLGALQTTLDLFIAEEPDHSASKPARALSASLTALLTRLNVAASEKDDQESLLRAISSDLLSLLPVSLERLQIAFEAQPFTQQELPASLKRHWQSQTGTYRMAVYPAEDINDNDALRRFVRAVQQVAPQATGAPVISLEAGEAVVDAFIHAFSLTLLGVVLALLILLRNITNILLVLVPLLLAALFTSAATVLLDVPFNFANIIALPLLLGIGIDSGIHMVHRSRHALVANENLMNTSTVRAIFYSTLTTLAGFGSLIFSPHQGTASMGLLLVAGIILMLICVLIILPALLQSLDQRRAAHN